jgi:hypothetical protein
VPLQDSDPHSEATPSGGIDSQGYAFWADLPPMTRSRPIVNSSTQAKGEKSTKASKGTTTRQRTQLISKPSNEENDENIASTQSLVNWSVTSLRWTSDGKRLVLLGRDSYCVCDVAFQFKSDICEQAVELSIVSGIGEAFTEEEKSVFKFDSLQDNETDFDGEINMDIKTENT